MTVFDPAKQAAVARAAADKIVDGISTIDSPMLQSGVLKVVAAQLGANAVDLPQWAAGGNESLRSGLALAISRMMTSVGGGQQQTALGATATDYARAATQMGAGLASTLTGSGILGKGASSAVDAGVGAAMAIVNGVTGIIDSVHQDRQQQRQDAAIAQNLNFVQQQAQQQAIANAQALAAQQTQAAVKQTSNPPPAGGFVGGGVTLMRRTPSAQTPAAAPAPAPAPAAVGPQALSASQLPSWALPVGIGVIALGGLAFILTRRR